MELLIAHYGLTAAAGSLLVFAGMIVFAEAGRRVALASGQLEQSPGR